MAKQRFLSTVGSVAAQVGCTPETVRQACNRGIVESIRDEVGRRLLPQDAARRLLDHRAATGSFTRRA